MDSLGTCRPSLALAPGDRITHPAVCTGGHCVSHPGAESGPHGPNGNGVTDPCQLPTAWEMGTVGVRRGCSKSSREAGHSLHWEVLGPRVREEISRV